MSLLELFCAVDDFLLSFEPHWKASRLREGLQRVRAGQLCPSEVMTILIHFHQSHYRTFKAYYTEQVQVHLTSEFPHLVRYQRFIALIPGVLVPMLAYAARADLGPVRASASLTRLAWLSVIPNGSASTGFLQQFQSWENQHGLVIRLQVAPGHECSRREAFLLFDSRQRR